mgnify:CR=1 FL=1
MSELQIKIWNQLIRLDGERLFTNYYGNRLLTEEFLEFLNEEL